MDRSKALLIYGLCMAAPVLAGGRPDGQDEGEVHANLPFTLSNVAAAPAAPAKATFTAIASMIPQPPAQPDTPLTANVPTPSVIVVPIKPSNAGGDNQQPKVTPVKFTGAATLLPATTAAPSLAAKSTPYIDDWRTRMTWPPGCEEWANPCPQGSPLSGGGFARTLSNNYVPVGSQSGYVNPFTSLLTMTDENGVVTGMPPKATLPAGVTALPPWVTRTSSATVVASASASTVVVAPDGAKGAKSASVAGVKPSASASGPTASKNSASTAQLAGAAVLAGLLAFAVALV